MRKLGILLLGSLFLSGISIAQADSWHGGKHNSASKGSKGHHASVYGTHHNKKPNVGRHITYGPQHSKKKHNHDAASKKHNRKVIYSKPAKVVHVPPKRVVYVKPKHHSYHHRPHRPKYVYVKPVYAPRYYGHHLYRGFYWPFANVSIVVNLTSRQIEHHHHAIYSALDAPIGHIRAWHDGGWSGNIVILRVGYDSHGNLCKKYRQTVTHHGRKRSSIEHSCLSPRGYWISV